MAENIHLFMVRDSVGQEFSQDTLQGTPECFSQRIRRLSWGLELAEGFLTHFSRSWCWLLPKAYLRPLHVPRAFLQ